MLNLEALTTMNPTFAVRHTEFYDAVRSLNAVINGEDAKAIDMAKEACDDAAEAFNHLADDTAYVAFINSDNPVLACLTTASIAHVRYTVKNSKTMGKSAEATTEQTMVNLDTLDNIASKFEKRVMASVTWKMFIDEARKAICGYVAKSTQDNGATMDKFIKQFDSTFEFAHKGARADMGESDIAKRYSVNKCTEALQTAVDCIIYDDPAKGGKNSYRVLKKDVHVIEHTIAKKDSRNLNTIQFPTYSAFARNFTDTLIRIVNNNDYVCSYSGNEVKKK